MAASGMQNGFGEQRNGKLHSAQNLKRCKAIVLEGAGTLSNAMANIDKGTTSRNQKKKFEHRMSDFGCCRKRQATRTFCTNLTCRIGWLDFAVRYNLSREKRGFNHE